MLACAREFVVARDGSRVDTHVMLRRCERDDHALRSTIDIEAVASPDVSQTNPGDRQVEAGDRRQRHSQMHVSA